jgi:hypothetical protein
LLFSLFVAVGSDVEFSHSFLRKHVPYPRIYMCSRFSESFEVKAYIQHKEEQTPITTTA